MGLYSEKSNNYFSTARQDILCFVPDHSSRVLEIGCGSGETLELLKNKGLCDETVGIELFESAAAEASKKNIDKVYQMNVENDELPSDLGKFDLLLILDVLEHLVDPWKVLTNLVSNHLEENGKVIISLPNAQHFSLVLPLLAGRFNYVERGILDKTHLRFFTKKSCIELLLQSGLDYKKVKPKGLDIALNSGKINAITFGVFSKFLTTQYIITGSKP